MHHPNGKPSWRFVVSFLRHKRKFLFILLGVLVAEITLGSWLLPQFLPAHWYFGLYTSAGAALKARMFAQGQFNVIPDATLGWKNKPQGGHGQFDTTSTKIEFDQYGSRSYRGLQAGKRLPMRVLLFGDSRINGWTYVNNGETINGWMERENAKVESLNLATDLYGLDQIYLTMQRALPDYQPDVVVVGLGSDEDNLLDCHCIVLKENRLEHDLPLLKPRFIRSPEGKLHLTIPPMQDLLLHLPEDAARFVTYLRQHDGCYGRFQRFQRWEFTPILASFNYLREKLIISGGRRWDFGQFRSLENLSITSELLKSMRELAKQQQVRLIFILLPTAYEYAGSKSFVYGQVRKALEYQAVEFIDALTILQHATTQQAFYHDDVHLSAEANQLLARALLQRLEK